MSIRFHVTQAYWKDGIWMGLNFLRFTCKELRKQHIQLFWRMDNSWEQTHWSVRLQLFWWCYIVPNNNDLASVLDTSSRNTIKMKLFPIIYVWSLKIWFLSKEVQAPKATPLAWKTQNPISDESLSNRIVTGHSSFKSHHQFTHIWKMKVSSQWHSDGGSKELSRLKSLRFSSEMFSFIESIYTRGTSCRRTIVQGLQQDRSKMTWR